ncbi:MAG: hypothetical protein ABFS19_05000 [Thermodesulfobacteriota bacterium]
MSEKPFKTCTTCFHKWQTVDELLEDPSTVILGYQANFNQLETGLFFFNHRQCGNTISLFADDFIHLHSGPVFTRNKTEKDGCPTYCLYKEELDPCKNDCECRWVRDVLQIIRDWEKK